MKKGFTILLLAILLMTVLVQAKWKNTEYISLVCDTIAFDDTLSYYTSLVAYFDEWTANGEKPILDKNAVFQYFGQQTNDSVNVVLTYKFAFGSDTLAWTNAITFSDTLEAPDSTYYEALSSAAQLMIQYVTDIKVTATPYSVESGAANNIIDVELWLGEIGE